VLAPNPGPFTGSGTNTWLLDSDGELVVIDPGPIDDGHASAISEAVGGRDVVTVMVTHTHEDHAPLANPLARQWQVSASGHAPGRDFDPDIRLTEGATVPVGNTMLEVVHTPGHSDDHLCFKVGSVLFTGDHIMGGSSVMVEDMVSYIDSLERLARIELTRLYPGHGEIIDDPAGTIDWYLAHRRQRERQILDAIERGVTTLPDIVEDVYSEVDPALLPLAMRSATAHVGKLISEGLVRSDGDLVRLPGDAG